MDDRFLGKGVQILKTSGMYRMRMIKILKVGQKRMSHVSFKNTIETFDFHISLEDHENLNF